MTDAPMKGSRGPPCKGQPAARCVPPVAWLRNPELARARWRDGVGAGHAACSFATPRKDGRSRTSNKVYLGAVEPLDRRAGGQTEISLVVVQLCRDDSGRVSGGRYSGMWREMAPMPPLWCRVPQSLPSRWAGLTRGDDHALRSLHRSSPAPRAGNMVCRSA